MAFDRNNPAHLTALKDEIQTDPIAMGYNWTPAYSAPIIAGLLNNPASNVGGETGPDYVTAEKLLTAIFPEPVSAQDQFKVQLVFEIAQGKEEDLSSFKTEIASLGVNFSAAIDSIVRPLSRGEVLFANTIEYGVTEYVVISSNDVSKAINEG